MSNIHRVRRQLAGSRPKGLFMADTGMKFNGGSILIAVGGPEDGKQVCGEFRAMMGAMVYRASRVNMYDVLNAQAKVRSNLGNLEVILN